MRSFSFELTVNPARLAFWADLKVGLDAPRHTLGTSYDHTRYPVLRGDQHLPCDLAPMQQGRPLSVIEDERRELAGYVPVEKLGSVRRYRDAFRHRRCIIPADRLNHLQHTSPSCSFCCNMTLASGMIFGLAGLWESFEGENGCTLHTFAVITTLVAPAMHRFADRIPIIIPDKERRRWLNPEQKEVPEDLLSPLHEDDLRGWKLEPSPV